MAKPKGSTNHPYFEAEEVPRAGLPDANKINRQAKLWRWLVTGSLILFPFALFAAFAGGGAGGGGAVSSAASATSPGRAAATETLRGWLAATPSPLPGGELVSWDGATSLGETRVENEPYRVETVVEHFTVGVRADAPTFVNAPGGTTSTTSTTAPSSSKGDPTITSTSTTTTTIKVDGEPVSVWSETYQADVLVAIDSRGGAASISAPSLVPIAGAATDGWVPADISWPGLARANATDPVRVAVQRWAAVYATGSGEDLRLATGDPSADDFYTPMNIEGRVASSVTASVTGAGSVDGGKSMVVRVELNVVWPDQDVDSTGQPVAGPSFDLDVLVERAGTAAPIVVAWGGPGSGQDLLPYANALHGDRTDAGITDKTKVDAGDGPVDTGSSTEPATTAAPSTTAVPATTTTKATRSTTTVKPRTTTTTKAAATAGGN